MTKITVLTHKGMIIFCHGVSSDLKLKITNR